MSLIFEVNEAGQKILSRNGRLLCSPRDPQREAQSWLERQKLTGDDAKVLVLGLGAGHHVCELTLQYPHLRIDILELDAEVLSSQRDDFNREGFSFFSSIGEVRESAYDAILSFRPAWSQNESQYLDIFMRLTQKSESSFATAAEAAGLITTAVALKKRISEIPFSLKDLDFVQEEGADPEIKLWRCLRELVG